MRDFEATIQMVAVKKIIPSKKNVRIHTKEQITFLCEIIDEFGFDQPIVVDGNMVIIKGQGRLLAAKRLKMKKVPVLVRGDISEGYADLSRIVDNDTVEQDWDQETLLLEASSIDLSNADFGTETTDRIEALMDTGDDEDFFGGDVSSLDVSLDFKYECPHCDYRWD